MNTVFPTPPGRLGQAPSVQEMLAYLGALDAWLGQRRAELDSLDSQILAAGRQAEFDADMTLSMSLWQAVRNRQAQLLTTWDSGRVGPIELERLSGLIWGRLDTGTGGDQIASLAVSLPEAGRLSDALVDQLRTRLNTDPQAEQHLIRLRNLRAQIERLRDQVALEPPTSAQQALASVEALAARLEAIAEKQARGGDIGGLLGPLEIDAARLERDLIVGAAQRRAAQDLLSSVRSRLAATTNRRAAVAALAEQIAGSVWPAPTEQIPAVADLGPMPNTRTGLVEYQAKLEDLGDHLARVEAGLRAAGSELDQANGLAEALGAKASAIGADDTVLTGCLDLAATVRRTQPVPLPVLRHLLQAATARLDQLQGRGV